MRPVVLKDERMSYIHRRIESQDRWPKFANVENQADAALSGKLVNSFADVGRNRPNYILVALGKVCVGLIFLIFQIALQPLAFVLFGRNGLRIYNGIPAKLLELVSDSLDARLNVDQFILTRLKFALETLDDGDVTIDSAVIVSKNSRINKSHFGRRYSCVTCRCLWRCCLFRRSCCRFCLSRSRDTNASREYHCGGDQTKELHHFFLLLGFENRLKIQVSKL